MTAPVRRVSESTDFYISLAARAFRVGEYSRNRDRVSKWTAACGAWFVVGTRNGGTRKLQERIKAYNALTDTWEPASADTVEALARAYDMFLYIRTWDHRKAWEARRAFGYTRFALLGEAQRMYEFSPEQAYDFLFQSNAGGQYLGGRAMMAFVADVCDARPEWKRRLTPLVTWCKKYLTDYDSAPESFKAKLREVLDEAQKLQEAG